MMSCRLVKTQEGHFGGHEKPFQVLNSLETVLGTKAGRPLSAMKRVKPNRHQLRSHYKGGDSLYQNREEKGRKLASSNR